MENINFYEQINLFLENKRPRKPRPAYVSMDLGTQLGFQKPMNGKFSALKIEVWNESHLIWEPFQTPIFQLYKTLYGIFQEHEENPKEKPKIHQK